MATSQKLEVKDFHTYFISDVGILVHNACFQGIPSKPWDIQKYSKGTLKVNFSGKNMTAHFDGKFYWLDDLAGHGTNGTSSFKVFTKNGSCLDWYADADMYGNFVAGKHKGQKGMHIKL